MIGKNNPFNIRNNPRNKWLGQTGSMKGFCNFSAEKYGIRAAAVIISNYMKFGLRTPMQIIRRFAPPNENNTLDYVRYVCVHADLYSDRPINGDNQFLRLLAAMSEFEGNKVAYARIFEVLNYFNFKYPSYEKENIKFD